AAVAGHKPSTNKVGRDEPPGGPGTGASIYMRSDRGDLSNLLTTGSHILAHERSLVMKDQVTRIEYFALTADDKPGVGADLGKRLAKEGVNLLGLLAFPTGPGKVQVDMIPENPEAFTKAVRKLGLTIGAPKAAFRVQGADRAGAMGEVLDRLGIAKINVRST